jgi:hypothetical protein
MIHIAKYEQDRCEDDYGRKYDNEHRAAAHEQACYDGENNAGYADGTHHIGGTGVKRQVVGEYVPVY